MKIICKHCGAILNSDAEFCTCCGKKIGNKTSDKMNANIKNILTVAAVAVIAIIIFMLMFKYWVSYTIVLSASSRVAEGFKTILQLLFTINFFMLSLGSVNGVIICIMSVLLFVLLLLYTVFMVMYGYKIYKKEMYNKWGCYAMACSFFAGVITLVSIFVVNLIVSINMQALSMDTFKALPAVYVVTLLSALGGLIIKISNKR